MMVLAPAPSTVGSFSCPLFEMDWPVAPTARRQLADALTHFHCSLTAALVSRQQEQIVSVAVGAASAEIKQEIAPDDC